MQLFPENLIVNNFGGELRYYSQSEIKKKPHPAPKKPLPRYQLASPVTEWGALGDTEVPVSPQLCPQILQV